jgi:hypothetical protein
MTERFDEKERLSDIPLEDLEKEAEKIALLGVMKKVAKKKILKDLRMKELAERKKKAGKILRRFMSRLKVPLISVLVILLCYCIHSVIDAQERREWAAARQTAEEAKARQERRKAKKKQEAEEAIYQRNFEVWHERVCELRFKKNRSKIEERELRKLTSIARDDWSNELATEDELREKELRKLVEELAKKWDRNKLKKEELDKLKRLAVIPHGCWVLRDIFKARPRPGLYNMDYPQFWDKQRKFWNKQLKRVLSECGLSTSSLDEKDNQNNPAETGTMRDAQNIKLSAEKLAKLDKLTDENGLIEVKPGFKVRREQVERGLKEIEWIKAHPESGLNLDDPKSFLSPALRYR